MILTNGGRRIATAMGAMLADPDSLGNLAEDAQETLFDPEYWRARGELVTVTGGRGSAWFIASGARQWVLRHFRRGGFIARLSQDGYVWTGEEGVRAFAEWRLLELLARRGLPVPRPEPVWRAVGATVARLHGAGVDHADLNAHNILLGVNVKDGVSVIDFDRGRLRAQGAWRARNLRRLRRSLAKIARDLPADRYSEETWDWLMAGYEAAAK